MLVGAGKVGAWACGIGGSSHRKITGVFPTGQRRYFYFRISVFGYMVIQNGLNCTPYKDSEKALYLYKAKGTLC